MIDQQVCWILDKVHLPDCMLLVKSTDAVGDDVVSKRKNIKKEIHKRKKVKIFRFIKLVVPSFFF